MRNFKNLSKKSRYRRGSVAVLFALLIIPLLGLIAFVVDYGYLIATRVDLQRTADHAVLAAVQDLAPDTYGVQDLALVRSTLRQYVQDNLGDNFVVRDEDIAIGRYNPNTIYSNLDLYRDGVLDTVGVTLRYDDSANHSIALFFARVLGINQKDMTATAYSVLQKARYLKEGSDILPIAIPTSVWNNNQSGTVWSIYGTGKIEDVNGHQIPGNWGTIDIGAESNGANELVDQIYNGLRQIDVDSLYSAGKSDWPDKIDSEQNMWLSGDTGISSGIKESIINSHGQTKLVPLFDVHNDLGGGNLQFHIVSWGVVEVVDSNWNGNNKTYLKIRKSYKYDGDLRPHPSLSNDTDVIENAFTSPVLIK